jgi:DnaK suppressor protein
MDGNRHRLPFRWPVSSPARRVAASPEHNDERERLMATPTTAPRHGAAPDAPELGRLRKKLEHELADLRADSDTAAAAMAALQRTGEDGPGDQVDVVSRMYDWDRENAALNDRRHRIQQMEHALERLAAGTYGWCERCGGRIPTARLRAFPSATLCVACKAQQEQR